MDKSRLVPTIRLILIHIDIIITKEFMPDLSFNVQVIAIAIAKYERVKLGVKYKVRK
ncbi:MAG: hypothetical protein ACI8TE_000017 [Francisella sp.]|jgi:hypothetical protein